MAYKINGTTVVDNSRNVCACCVTSCCITASDRLDAPSGTTASRPASPVTGSIYFDTDEGSLLTYDGTAWKSSGVEANGMASSTPNAISSSSPYTFYTESYACIHKTAWDGIQPFRNYYWCNTPFWDFGTLITNCNACLNIAGVANFTGARLMRNNLIPQCAICNNYVREYEKPHDCSPHFLNDGSFFSIATASQSGSSQSVARYYAGCGCDARQSYLTFACLVASNGTHGELTWPFSTTSGTTCCDCVIICSVNCTCGAVDIKFTHMYVPFGRGPEGQCELTVGSYFHTYPFGLMGVMHSCDFGKTKFNFKYYTYRDYNYLYLMGRCTGKPVPDQHNVWLQRSAAKSTPCFYCISPFSLTDFVAHWCCCVCTSICYPTFTSLSCIWPAWYSKKNLSLLCNYCTSDTSCACGPHPLTNSVNYRHTLCDKTNFYGIYWTVAGSSYYCTCTCHFKDSEIMSVPSNKHFVSHFEHNPIPACYVMFCSCSNTGCQYSKLPILEIFDTENHCKVTCIHYKYFDTSCKNATPPIILDCYAICMLSEFKGILPSYSDDGCVLYLQNKTDPTKHYYGVWMQGGSLGHCLGSPCQCCATNLIITFCETSCNIAITDPWVGATLRCNLSCSQYFTACCFRPTPISCIYTCLNTCPNCFAFVRPMRPCCSSPSPCNGTPQHMEYFNPCTNSFITTLLLMYCSGVAIKCIAGHFLVCYDIENRCWAEAVSLWDAERAASCHGCTNTCRGPGLFSACWPGQDPCGEKFNFVKYDDGVYYQYYLNCVGRGCSRDTYVCGILCTTCCPNVCGGIANIHYKIPYTSKFCDVPGMFEELCLVEFLNYNVTNSLCCYQYQYIYPFWSCLTVGKRYSSNGCNFEFVGYIGPNDVFGCPSKFCEECYLGCICCLRSFNYPTSEAHSSITGHCVYTSSNSNPDCYDSDFITCGLGLNIRPGCESTSIRSYLTHFGKSNFKYCVCNTKGDYIYNVRPCIPGLSYCG